VAGADHVYLGLYRFLFSGLGVVKEVDRSNILFRRQPMLRFTCGKEGAFCLLVSKS